jgi:hypothetical protein
MAIPAAPSSPSSSSMVTMRVRRGSVNGDGLTFSSTTRQHRRVTRSPERLRLAIAGCGNISQLNVPGYLQRPGREVVALCDTAPERAKRRAGEWGITPRIYSDFAKVLDDDAIDAVELLTPTWLHADQVVAALEAGKHVSCQKPRPWPRPTGSPPR